MIGSNFRCSCADGIASTLILTTVEMGAQDVSRRFIQRLNPGTVQAAD